MQHLDSSRILLFASLTFCLSWTFAAPLASVRVHLAVVNRFCSRRDAHNKRNGLRTLDLFGDFGSLELVVFIEARATCLAIRGGQDVTR